MAIGRLTKQPAENRLFDFDFAGKMRTGETISTVVSVVAAPSGLTVGATAFSGQVAQVRLSGGTDQTEYILTCKVTTSAGNTLELDGLLWVEDQSGLAASVLVATVGSATANSYATLVEANAYFATRLGGSAWLDVEDGALALITATAELDRFNYYGSKTDSDQALKFPRTGIEDDEGTAYEDDVVPTAVKRATFELALYLAENPDVLDSGGDLSEFKSLELGNQEVAIQPSGSGSSNKLPSRVMRLLSSLRISQARVVRA